MIYLLIRLQFEMPEIKAYLVAEEKKITLNLEENTIGRLTTSTIPINDPTISKQHASINYVGREDRYFLRDLGTVNGTYLNGGKIQPNKSYPLKHKDNIQFGKHPLLFAFLMAQPEHQKKGKINLKDYCFELESDGEEKEVKINREPPQKTSSVAVSKPAIGKEGRKLKIPNIADFLELEESIISQKQSQKTQMKDKTKSKFNRSDKIRIPKGEEDFEQQQLSKLRNEQEGRRNLFLKRQAQKRQKQQKFRALQQEKICLQILKIKQEEEMAEKQIELQSRLRDEQQRMQMQRRRIEQELLTREQQRRQRQRQTQQQQRERQKRFLKQLQEQKENQIRKVREQSQSLRSKNQQALKEDLQRKKKELQTEAQALATQYQQIYRDTIRKMKNDIEKEERQIIDLQANIERMKEENEILSKKYKQVSQAAQLAKKQHFLIIGRNKAILLYASELQNKLDGLKGEKVNKEEKKVSAKIKEEVIHSRKLLAMKKQEIKSLEEQIVSQRTNLGIDNRSGRGDMLETIVSNHSAIQHCKSLYFEYLREEQLLRQLWDSQLSQNQRLQQQGLTISKECDGLRKQLLTNVRDNGSRLTQQRLHMLKCLHYLPEQKKKAARFLIEEMVTMQEQVRGMVADQQQSHTAIQQLVIDSQRKKLENQHLSELLFGADSTSHHFDNMKLEINGLFDRLSLERDQTRVVKRLKQTEEVEASEVAIYQLSLKLQQMRNRWREGLQGQKVLLPDKNPLIYFGDQLSKRENDQQQAQFQINKLEREVAEMAVEVQELQKKKKNHSQSLEAYKREELPRVRQDYF